MKNIRRGLFIGLIFMILIPTVFADGVRYVFREDLNDVIPPVWPPGWMVQDDGDGMTWTSRYTGGARGSNSARFISSNAGDDWLYSPALSLQSGTEYTLSFTRRVTSAALPHHLSVWLGTAQSPSFMTISILNLPSIQNTDTEDTESTFTLGSSGNYYLGFHCTSNPASLGLYLDNIGITLPESDLQLTLQMDKIFYEGSNSYKAGEDKACLAFVTNTGTSPLWVNSAFCLGYEPNPNFVISFRVTDPDGLAVETRAKFEPHIPEDEDFVELNQDEIVYKFYDLMLGGYDFSKTGDYTIQAVYKNLFESESLNVWLGKIYSNSVTINIY